jgi:asparagine synthase (glutamine-hydrolysing)
VSGILGIWNLNGKPIESWQTESMRNAMAYWGPDGIRLWHGGEAGLGQFILFNTPEAVRENLPRWLPEPGIAFTAEARIDNREELCNQLGIDTTDRVSLPDGDLLLSAYLEWGKATPDRVLGDWSFAAWHAREKRIFLARDHHGNTSLYFYRDTNLFAFASSINALLSLPEIPKRLNELRLAQVLTSWPGDGTQSMYEQIQILPPAHTLEITPEECTKNRYWFLENTPELRLANASEYAEGLRAVLTEAVHCRLRSHRPVGATLSGGLDSTSVSVLAAQELKTRGERLLTFSAIPNFNVTQNNSQRRFGDETPYIQSTAAFVENIDPHFLRSEDIPPLAGLLLALNVHHAPTHAASNSYWIADILEHARRDGLGTLLTGQGGNGTISWQGQPWLPPGLAKNNPTYWTLKIKNGLLLPRIPSALLFRRERQIANRRRWEHSAILPSFANRIQLSQKRFADEASRGELGFQIRTDAHRMRFAVTQPGRSRGGQLWAEWGAAFGLEVRDPTLDKRVMSYCISVPNQAFTGPGNLDRYLLRQAMRGVLPPDILNNQRRGLQAADLASRIQADAQNTRAALEELAAARLPREYINIPILESTFQQCLERQDSQYVYNSSVAILLRGLMVGFFLARCSLP